MIVTNSFIGCLLIEKAADLFYQINIFPLIVATDDIGFSTAAVIKGKVKRSAMIAHVKPVAHIFSFAVHRDILPFQSSADNRGNQFLIVLMRTEVVRTIGGYHIHIISMKIGAHNKIAGGFGSRIG